MELSILIPARNEMFLEKTVSDILEHIEADTEVIVGLDGEWSQIGIVQSDRVKIIYYNSSIGQRAITNKLAKIARGKYLMKVDAHCSFDQGFDRKMIEKMEPDITMVPIMRNLHAFDWVCEDGHRRYQGPSGKCEQCGKDTRRDIIWEAKKSPQSTGYRFDKTMHFQYWGELKKRYKGELTPTLSIQGSCFMLTKEKYFELDICSEDFHSWGQQGVEVACKTWMSGGRVLVNHTTWYAHMFRTQGGDFSFPYPQSGKAINENREKSRLMFQHNKWKGATVKFEDVLEKFRPVPEWHDDGELPKKKKITKGAIYYTDNRLPEKLALAVRRQITRGIKQKHIVSATLSPIQFGRENIVIKQPRGILAMNLQQLKALEAHDSDIIYFLEHDVLYHPSHFEFIPEADNAYYYNTSVWKLSSDGIYRRTDDCKQVSGLVAYRDLLVEHYRKRVARLLSSQAESIEKGEPIKNDGYNRSTGFEPGTHKAPRGIDDYNALTYNTDFANVDLRGNWNLTPTKTSPDQFRNPKYAEGWLECSTLKGWGNGLALYNSLLDI